MRTLLQWLISGVALALCGICTLQWLREADYRAHISQLGQKLMAENTARLEAERKTAEYAREVERVTQLRAETEEKLLAAVQELGLAECSDYGLRYEVYLTQAALLQAKLELASASQALGTGSAAIAERNTAVQSQNAAIEKQNAALKQLVAERNAAIEKLNARTQEFNELAEKYNQLVNQRK